MGLEPTTFTLATCKPTPANGHNDNDLRARDLAARSACAARSAENPLVDAELRALVDAWPALPDAVKVGILAMVRASADGGQTE
jgi:hypothetical protein